MIRIRKKGWKYPKEFHRCMHLRITRKSVTHGYLIQCLDCGEYYTWNDIKKSWDENTNYIRFLETELDKRIRKYRRYNK